MASPQFASVGIPSGSIVVSDESRLAEFKSCMEKHEISPLFAGKLRQLEGFRIVCILDDSGSMASPVDQQPGANPYGQTQTRWSELRSTVTTIIEIAGLLDRDGVDCYFLNRPGVMNVTPFNMNNLMAQFQAPPGGYTPMQRVVRQVIENNRSAIIERKLLLLIATDGIPTNDRGDEDREGLRALLKNRGTPERNPMTIIACTDEDDVMDYLNKLDNEVPSLDVIDDYKSERTEVLKAQGAKFRFTRGDWICKILLGSVDKDMDKLDEVKGCCSIM